jgi:hypothetical protein
MQEAGTHQASPNVAASWIWVRTKFTLGSWCAPNTPSFYQVSRTKIQEPPTKILPTRPRRAWSSRVCRHTYTARCGGVGGMGVGREGAGDRREELALEVDALLGFSPHAQLQPSLL